MRIAIASDSYIRTTSGVCRRQSIIAVLHAHASKSHLLRAALTTDGDSAVEWGEGWGEMRRRNIFLVALFHLLSQPKKNNVSFLSLARRRKKSRDGIESFSMVAREEAHDGVFLVRREEFDDRIEGTIWLARRVAYGGNNGCSFYASIGTTWTAGPS